MEGRTIARPNPAVPRRLPPGQHASMEGRTIARPNARRWRCGPCTRRGFNGGPDNCPAKHAAAVSLQLGKVLLQWRAGQLPGQTARLAA